MSAAVQKKLKVQIESLIRRDVMSATTLGYMLAGDPSFVTKLRAGHRFRNSTLQRAANRLGLLYHGRESAK